MGSKHRVTFSPANETNLNEKLPTKINRIHLRKPSRSFDQRISFRGRNAIYTAGIHLFILFLN